MIIFIIKIHPDGFVSINFSFATSAHKFHTFGMKIRSDFILICGGGCLISLVDTFITIVFLVVFSVSFCVVKINIAANKRV